MRFATPSSRSPSFVPRPRCETCRRTPRPWSFCSNSASGRRSPDCRRSASCRRYCLARQSLPRCNGPALSLQRAGSRTRSAGSRSFPPSRRAACVLRAALRLCLCTRRRTGELDAGASSLRQADGDGLLGRTRAMFSFTDVMYFLAHELTGLRRGCFSLSVVLSSAFQCCLFRHGAPPYQSSA